MVSKYGKYGKHNGIKWAFKKNLDDGQAPPTI